jgi:hypothetical protein
MPGNQGNGKGNRILKTEWILKRYGIQEYGLTESSKFVEIRANTVEVKCS